MTAKLSNQAIFYMILLSIQFGCQPMLTARFTPKTVCRSTVIFVQETVKFCLAMSMLLSSGKFQDAVKGWSIASWLSVAAVPAGLYTIQNTCALMAYQHLDGVTFNVLNQTKTLSAALCCYLLMGRRQSRVQIAALFILLVSALIIERIINIDVLFGGGLSSGSESEGVSVEEEQGDDNKMTALGPKHFTHGVAPVLMASFLSGLAGAISQKNLQSSSGCGSSGGRNPYLFSSELCIASLIVLTMSMSFSEDGQRIRTNGFFDQWTPQTFIPIVVNSMGGIIVGLVTKYAGSVRKGFALIFGMLFTGFIQSVLDGTPVSKEQVMGGLIAAISLWMHATNPYTAAVVSTETKQIEKAPLHSSTNGNGKKKRKTLKED